MSDKTNFDELFENDFFKDLFDTRVEKHLKSYNKRIEALGKSMKLHVARIDGHELRLDSIADKIKALEKKLLEIDNRYISHGDHKEFEEQITELRESIDYFKPLQNVNSLQEQINELKSDIGNINKILEVITEGRILELKAFNNLEEVLRKTLKKLADVGISGFIDEELLEKLDSEVLKDIKELAKAESDFYDKHGYFSFWSDGLKAQRIKELKGNKQFDDYSKVQNLINDPLNDLKPKKQTDIGEITLLHEDSEKRILQIKKDLEDESIMGHPIIYTNDEMKELLKEKRPEPLINSDLETVFPKEKPETLGDLFTPMEETEPDHIFICKGCGKKIFISRMNKLKGSYYCSECNPEPEKFPKIVYQLGLDSKEYVELKKKYDKLIEDIQTDLDELIAWANNYPKDSEIYIRIKRKREKWQEK